MSTLANANPTFVYSQTIGNQSTPPAHGFSAPVSVAIGTQGELFVICNYYEYQKNTKFIVKCSMDEDYIQHFGSYGTGPGEITWPNSLAVDNEGKVYLSDEWLNRITIFDNNGVFLGHWGEEGSENGMLNRPAGLAFDHDDNLLVADSLNHRIQKFTRDGKFLNSWGQRGHEPGEFNTPWGLTIDSSGNTWVADWRNDRVQQFSGDGSFIKQVGKTGTNPGEFNRPSGVAVDNEGCLYVVDWGNDRVQVFDPNGEFVTQFFGDCPGFSKWAIARMASDPEEMAAQRVQSRTLELERLFYQPTGIQVDSENRILIVDCGRHRIQIYQKASVSLEDIVPSQLGPQRPTQNPTELWGKL